MALKNLLVKAFTTTFCCCHVVGLLKIIISPFMLKKTLLVKRHFQLWSYRWLFKWVRTVLKHVFFPKSFIPADNSRQQAAHCCRKCVELFVRKVETLRKLTNKTYEHFVWWIPTYAKWRELRCVSRTYEHFCSYETLVNTAPGTATGGIFSRPSQDGCLWKNTATW